MAMSKDDREHKDDLDTEQRLRDRAFNYTQPVQFGRGSMFPLFRIIDKYRKDIAELKEENARLKKEKRLSTVTGRIG